MIVVSDTGPLHYLALIGCIEILPTMYGHILVPRVVCSKELSDPAAPALLRTLLQAPPEWLLIHNDPVTIHASVTKLGIGEAHALSLAIELHAELFLCDDLSARKKAAQLAIPTTGSL